MFNPGALVVAFQPPAVQGVGSYGGFQFVLQDTGRNTLEIWTAWLTRLWEPGRPRKDLTGLFTSFPANDPQVLVNIDREKAKAMNVPLSQITTALGVFMGSQYVNDFDFNNRTYRVYAAGGSALPHDGERSARFYVRSDSGR